MDYEFEQVDSSEPQIKILYSLLKVRAHRISHSETPNYECHSNFVKSPIL